MDRDRELCTKQLFTKPGELPLSLKKGCCIRRKTRQRESLPSGACGGNYSMFPFVRQMPYTLGVSRER